MSTGRLIDRQELLKLFPALRGRGKHSKWRLDWLVRQRAIPVVRVGKRSIFFDEDQIREWIQKNSIPAQNGAENDK